MGFHSRVAETKQKWRRFLRLRRFHYTKAFSGESGAWTLEDILKDAKTHETLFHENQRKQDFALGYRACALRLTRIMKLSTKQIDDLTHEGIRDDDD